MALKPCRECGVSVSSEAKQCLHCGVEQPVPRQPALGPAGIAVAGLVLVVVIIIGGSLSSSEEVGRNGVTASGPPSLGESSTERNSRDSARLAELRAAKTLSEGDALEADSLIHISNSGAVHDSIHVRAVRLHLDSAAYHLKPNKDGYGATALAQPHLLAVHPPLTSNQDARLSALRNRLVNQNARIRVVANKAAAQFMVKQRKEFAAKLENEYLDKGLDITVSTIGAQSTTLRIKWILVSRVLAHQFSQNGEMFANLRNAGFKKLVVTDGYDGTWYWDL